MVQLTAEELQALRKPQKEIRYPDHKVLIAALEKLGGSGDQKHILAGRVRLAVALERSRLPHEEKARHWEAAGVIAEKQNASCAELFAIAADHMARDGAQGRAAALFEKAAERGIAEQLDRSRVQSLLRDGRRMFEFSGHGSEAGRLFLLESDYLRETAPWPTKSWMWLYKLISAYGESPLRVAATASVLLLVCAVIYSVSGLHSNLTGQTTHTFSTSLYFSVVTFTTLGYGDYSPTNGLARLVATCEALAGLFLMSLFLVTLVRRFGRS